jgi:hypothetical protein
MRAVTSPQVSEAHSELCRNKSLLFSNSHQNWQLKETSLRHLPPSITLTQ